MPQTCGSDSRADYGGEGTSDAESVIAIRLLFEQATACAYAYPVVPA